MKVLVVGSGGREHALVWKLKQDSCRPDIFCAPGNAGTAKTDVNLDIQAGDIQGITAWTRQEKPDLTVIGPEAPLCEGLTDKLQAEGLRVFGPVRDAAQIEGSKVFAKDVMRNAGVPTGCSEMFSDVQKAKSYIRSVPLPVVVKADGLAAGKGVTVCINRDQAEKAVTSAMVDGAFGEAGKNILIEEYLEGEEVSVLAFVDGKKAVLLPSAQDHKRALDNDKGPNTGGMGAYSPAPMESAQFRKKVQTEVFDPVLKELDQQGICYQGVLYAGLMMTMTGMKVLEFNCRFGDPETQAVLPLLKGDLIPVMEACIDGKLKKNQVACSSDYCVCVVAASGGYPGVYRKGDVIKGLSDAESLDGIVVFHAGTRCKDNQIVTAGGRVLGVTGTGNDLESAAERAYKAVSMISFADMHFRRDIAAKGLRKNENK